MIESYIVKYNEDDNSLKVGGFRRWVKHMMNI
jgi:hypothetical protein